MLLRLHGAVEPTVVSGLQAGCAGLHIVLGVKMGTGGVRGANRFDDGELPFVPQGLQCAERGMKAEAAIQIDGGFEGAVRTGDGDGWT